jgi:hypothetical protein
MQQISAPPVGLNPVFVEQWLTIDEIFREAGFAKQPLRLGSIRSLVTMDLDGAHENANGYTAKFFQDADTASEFVKNAVPQIRAGVMVSNDHVAAMLALELEVNQEASGFTNTEVNELIEKLLDHVFELKVADDVIISDRIKNLLGGNASVIWASDGQGTPVTSRGLIARPGVAFHFPDPMILTPGCTVAAELRGNKTWTTTDDLPVQLYAPCAIGVRGAEPDAAKGVAYTLSRAKRSLDAFKDQINKGA